MEKPAGDETSGNEFGMTPRGLSGKEAAEYVGVGVETLERLGPPPLRIGRRKVWDRKLLDAWMDKLGGVSSEDKQGWTDANGTQIEVHS